MCDPWSVAASAPAEGKPFVQVMVLIAASAGGYPRGVTTTELGLPALRASRSAPRDPARPADPAARRPLRPRCDGPAHLADRSLQPALHLLHARRGPGVDAARRAAHRRRARPADHRRGPGPRRAGAAVHRRRAAAAPGARGRDRRVGRPCAAARHLAHHERRRPRPPRLRPRRRRGEPPQRLARHCAARSVCRHHASGPADRRTRGHGGRTGSRPVPRQDQYGAAARRQRRRGRGPAALRRRSWLRAAVHRADAAGRAARLATGGDGDGRGDPRGATRRFHAHRRTARSAAARRPSGGWSTVGRRRSA